MPMIKKGSPGITDKEPTAPVEKVGSVECKDPPMKYGKPLGAYELETDRRIHVSGIMQAVISSPVLAPFVFKQEDFARVVEEETRKLLAVAQKIITGN